ncbi:hypothetical protein MTR_7g033905 [Medicago truncatula]|uniref:Uncharacterized protein n=1 Tax=Medicago truncatula TaxID=3880 RepID=A0A072TZ69_MEDTR|nr:hypothetical protein MTR_7g033905 [Medicago truncatula]
MIMSSLENLMFKVKEGSKLQKSISPHWKLLSSTYVENIRQAVRFWKRWFQVSRQVESMGGSSKEPAEATASPSGKLVQRFKTTLAQRRQGHQALNILSIHKYTPRASSSQLKEQKLTGHQALNVLSINTLTGHQALNLKNKNSQGIKPST